MTPNKKPTFDCIDPNCDGNGTTYDVVSGIEAGCCGEFLPTGECCGNEIPVQTQELQLAPCQWCYENNHEPQK